MRSAGTPFVVAGVPLSRPFVLWSVFLLALGVRALYLLEYAQTDLWSMLSLDTETHIRLAQYLNDHGSLGDEAFFRAPLYPYLLGLLQALFGPGLLIPRLLNILLGSLSCVLVLLLGERFFRPNVGLLASLVACVYWVFLYFDGEILLVSTFVFLVLLTFHLFGLAAGRRLPWLALAGLVLGLASITRPNILVFYPAFLVALFPRARPWLRTWTVRSLVFFLPALVVVFGVTLRNYVVGGDLVLVAYQGGVNFYIGNNPTAPGHTAVPPYDVTRIPPEVLEAHRQDVWFNDDVWLSGYCLAEAEAQRRLTPSEMQDYWYGRAWEFIREQPVAYLALLARKTCFFLNAFEIPSNRDLNRIAREDSLLLGALSVLGFGVVISLGLLGWALHLWRRRGPGLLLAFVPVYSLTVIAFFVNGRYRVPVIPVLLLFGASGLFWLGDRLRRRDLGRALPALGALLGLLVLTHVDLCGVHSPRREANLRFNRGVIHYHHGRLDAAALEIQAAIELYPGVPRHFRLLCRILNALGRHEESIVWTTRGLEQAPADHALRSCRAVAEVGRGALPEAIADLERIREGEPGSGRDLGNLGELYFQNGQLDAAAGIFERLLTRTEGAPQLRFVPHLRLGAIALRRGQPAQALPHLQAAVALRDDNADALALLVETHLQLNDTAASREILATLRAQHPGDPRAAELRRRLAELAGTDGPPGGMPPR